MTVPARRTILVTAAVFVLGAGAVCTSIYVPRALEQQAFQAQASRAQHFALLIAIRAAPGLQATDTDRLKAVMESARLEEDLLYLVAVDTAGTVAAALNPFGAGHAAYWEETPQADHKTLYKTSLPVSLNNDEVGRLYLGLSLDRLQGDVARVRKWATLVSFLLLLTGALLLAGTARLNILDQQKEALTDDNLTLQEEQKKRSETLTTQKKTIGQLQESELRYRTLYERAIETAYFDLENLNRDLARQKNSLEHEVAERKRAERKLRHCAERLKALRDIERSILMNHPLPVIAGKALEHMKTLVPHTRASIVAYDVLSGEGTILAVNALGSTSLRAGIHIPLSFLGRTVGEEATKGVYFKDLTELPGPSPIEQSLIGEGIRSYFQVPLLVQNEVVGTLNVGAEAPDNFAPDAMELAREVADLLALCIRQHRIDSERELYEGELIAAKEHAEEMALLKSAFLTNMSHELRTPISGIIGFSQILYEETDEAHREFAELIENSARRLLNTVNAVLDLASLESNRMNLTTLPLQVVPEIERVVQLFQSSALKKGLALTFNRHVQEAWASLDQASLNRILTNLIENAIKFTNQGSIIVEVDENDTSVLIRVCDTGVGIAEEFLPRLFDEFLQESSGESRSHEGSGLGLAITKKLISRMNGKIMVDSTKGQGTAFEVSFPCLDRSQETPAAATLPTATLLMVEDKEDALFLLEYTLRDRYVTTVAANMDIARRLASNTSFDAVLIDINLNGAEIDLAAVSGLRALRTLQNAPLLAMATQLLPEDWERYLNVGFDTYVTEPFVRDTLLASLDKARQNKR